MVISVTRHGCLIPPHVTLARDKDDVAPVEVIHGIFVSVTEPLSSLVFKREIDVKLHDEELSGSPLPSSKKNKKKDIPAHVIVHSYPSLLATKDVSYNAVLKVVSAATLIEHMRLPVNKPSSSSRELY